MRCHCSFHTSYILDAVVMTMNFKKRSMSLFLILLLSQFPVVPITKEDRLLRRQSVSRSPTLLVTSFECPDADACPGALRLNRHHPLHYTQKIALNLFFFPLQIALCF